MMETKTITCIICPRGCKLTVSRSGEKIDVRGYSCEKGLAYGIEEVTNPVRTVTTTVQFKNTSGEMSMLPVRTSAPAPKSLIIDIVRECGKITVSRPVKPGDIIIKNILGCGSDIIASSEMH